MLIYPCYLHGFSQGFACMFIYMMAHAVNYAIFFAVNHWVDEVEFSDNSNVSNTNWGEL